MKLKISAVDNNNIHEHVTATHTPPKLRCKQLVNEMVANTILY